MTEIRNYLDFEIVKENWNIYNLQDGTILKTRNMLRSAWFIKKDDKKSYSVDIKSDTVIMCATNLQGQKNNATFTQELIKSNVEVGDCRYDTLSYEPEEYVLEGNIKILIHSNITQISRTKLFDRNGNRIYQVHINSSVTITPPPQ